MFVLVAPRQFQIVVRRLLCFLDESVEAPPVDIKKHARDSVLGQARPHFMDAVAHWPANRHPNRPAELHGLDILSDAFPVIGWQLLEPFSQPLSARFSAIEDRRNPLALSFNDLRLQAWSREGLGFPTHGKECTIYGTYKEVRLRRVDHPQRRWSGR